MKTLSLLLLAASLVWAQTAKFPVSVATDAQLGVAKNRVSTTLAFAAAAGDTSVLVTSFTGIVPSMLLSVDSEIMLVTSVAGNAIGVTRAFDSTAAASHAAGAAIGANLDAWHHNAMAAEVKAMETTLFANFLPLVPSYPNILMPGTLTLGPVPTSNNYLLITPPANTYNRGFFIQQSIHGSGAFNANAITITADDGAATCGATCPFSQAFQVAHHFGGAATYGGRNAIESDLYFDGGATNAGNLQRNYAAVQGQVFALNGDGGTGLTTLLAKGAIFGGGFLASGQAGATNLLGVIGAELNFGLDTGSSAALLAGLTIAGTPTAAVHGSILDTYIDIGGQGAYKPNFVVLLNDFHGTAPVGTNSTILGTDGNAHTLLAGIDLSAYTFTGNFLKSRGFTVDGNGSVFAAGLSATPALFSTIGTCNPAAAGAHRTVSDPTVLTWGSTLGGTGTAAVPYVSAFCDGANWTVAGK